MGTHAAFGITWADGTHECVERTLDGDLLVTLKEYVFQALRVSGIDEEALRRFVESAPFGNGEIERGPEREHEEEYFLYVNLEDHRVIASPSIFLIPDEVVYWFAKLVLEMNWIFEFGFDCPEDGESS